jgi:hypothetical protein
MNIKIDLILYYDSPSKSPSEEPPPERECPHKIPASQHLTSTQTHAVTGNRVPLRPVLQCRNYKMLFFFLTWF